MKAILLAAGLGTRLKPITNTTPKCLVEINGKPLLSFWLEMLTKAGVNDIIINTHHLSSVVVDYISNSRFNKTVTIVYEEILLGTGGTLLKNKSWIQNEQVILIHADNLSVFDMKEFINTHKNRPPICEITMMTFETDSPKLCGIVEIDKNGIVVDFHEKIENPPGNHANGAVYIIEPSLIPYLESKKKDVIDFSTEVIPNYLGKINTFKNNIYHRDIGNIESYNRAIVEFKHLKKI